MDQISAHKETIRVLEEKLRKKKQKKKLNNNSEEKPLLEDDANILLLKEKDDTILLLNEKLKEKEDGILLVDRETKKLLKEKDDTILLLNEKMNTVDRERRQSNARCECYLFFFFPLYLEVETLEAENEALAENISRIRQENKDYDDQLQRAKSQILNMRLQFEREQTKLKEDYEKKIEDNRSILDDKDTRIATLAKELYELRQNQKQNDRQTEGKPSSSSSFGFVYNIGKNLIFFVTKKAIYI